MSKSWLNRATRGLASGPLEAVLLLGLCGCQPQSAGAEPPAWPKQEPPEYPGVSPQPAHDPAAAPGASHSPWAATHAGRSAVDRFEGDATYYADSLAGNHTANGDTYRPEAFTAAHRTLPFGTIVRVTRTDTPSNEAQPNESRRVTYVKVNDRGPFGSSRRVIDLSRAAATELEMLRAGVVPVQVEILELPPK